MARLFEILAIMIISFVYTSNMAQGRTFYARTNEKQLDPKIVGDIGGVLLSDSGEERNALEKALDDCFKKGDPAHQKQAALATLAHLRQIVASIPQTKRKLHVSEDSDDGEGYFYRRDAQEMETALKELPKFLSFFTDGERIEFHTLHKKLLTAPQSFRDEHTAMAIEIGNRCANNQNIQRRTKLYQYLSDKK